MKRCHDLAEVIEDSYQGNIVHDIFLDEEDRRLIVKALHAYSAQSSAESDK